MVVLTSNTQQLSEDLRIQLYPNPTTDMIYLDVNNTFSKQLTLKLYTNNGELVYKKPISGTGKMNNINISNLPRGQYIYVVEQESKILDSGKLILHTSR